jgi:hypothetical protein
MLRTSNVVSAQKALRAGPLNTLNKRSEKRKMKTSLFTAD